ncbi:MAG: glycoside hydrolase family 3 C-terminal domain-containing protein [Bacilli bacterium]|nr:glycoside hydrolase family 3 C-terminal domain-containing protein [Bacilli bacterium]
MDKIDELITQLTLEEKVGLLSGKNAWETLSIERLEIPSIHMSDGPHGLRTLADSVSAMDEQEAIQATCFPPESTIACSFDRDLVNKMGIAIGEEALKNKVHIVLGPGVNIKRSPRCGRNFEYYSEDPYLAGEYGAAFVNGLQSKNVGACVKHFACNSQENYRFSTNALVDERALHEIYLEAFRKVVTSAKPWSIMGSYNKINGVYGCENAELLHHLLRETWGFDGIVISDWGATNERVLALKAGLDLEMPSSHSYNDEKVYHAMNKGEVDGICIDESVCRILKIAEKIQDNEATDYQEIFHHELAYEIAKESFVLLKNDGILPLNIQDDFIVIGELARNPHIQGGGSSKVNPVYVNNPLYEMKKLKDRIAFYPGYSDKGGEQEELMGQAVNAAKNAKNVILFLGLTDALESEGADRKTLDLPHNQLALLDAISRLNRNIIVVLQGGGVINCDFENKCRAILHTLLMGQAGAKAVAEMLFGEVSPGGKLAETYPLKLADTPCFNYYPGGAHNAYYPESIFVGYRYYDSFAKPVRYPFGYGLSYTTFDLGTESILQTKNAITVRCSVTNTGKYAGSEVVQVYVRNKSKKDFYAYQELKGFEKVHLKRDETKMVNINIPISEFKYYDTRTKRFEVESGTYEIAIGTSSRAIHRVFPIVIYGTINKPTPDNIRSCYYTKSAFSLEDYRRLLGLIELPPEVEDHSKNYDLNTTIGEIKNTFVGKQIYKMAKDEVKKTSIMPPEILESMIDSITLRMAALSGTSMSQMEGVVMMLNGRMIKGYQKFKKPEGVSLNGKA